MNFVISYILTDYSIGGNYLMFSEKMQISDIFKNKESYSDRIVNLCGWVRNIRDSKNLGFIDLSDGSTIKCLQVVFEAQKLDNFDEVKRLNVAASIKVTGRVVLTPSAKQTLEIQAENIEIYNSSTPDYPLQKKRHSLEFLRSMTHLRARTNTLGASFRLRAKAAFAIHQFFNGKGFYYVNTPIITHSDCEGAGAMFTATSLDLDKLPLDENGKVDYEQDFFKAHSSLTVSGQLEAECMAMALGKVYTFGPTFRAEKSNTQRHAAEFWMIEPEIAFADLDDNMTIAEEMVKHVVSYVLENCYDDISFFNQFIDKTLIERLTAITKLESFNRISYTQAIEILEKNNDKFAYKVKWGCDLQTEHEKYLTEEVFKAPVFVTDYPKEIKAFYMKLNKDQKTVAAMDLLLPGIGELIGGSQREENLEILEQRMEEFKMDKEEYSWYLDLRRYGSCVHSGFGLGFERLLMYLSGIQNIRDVLPFPRTC